MQVYGKFNGRDGYSRAMDAPEHFPTCFRLIIERLIEQGIYTADDCPIACVVTAVSRPRRPQFSMLIKPSYADVIADISLGASCLMRFEESDIPKELETMHELADWHRNHAKYGGHNPRTGRRTEITLQPGSLLVIKGVARWRWLHAIPAGKLDRSSVYRRISITFRAVNGQRTPYSQLIFKDTNKPMQKPPTPTMRTLFSN